MDNFKEVTKEEFYSFVYHYPVQLSTDTNYIPDHPITTFNDFSNGKVWPESVVAKAIHTRDGAEFESYKIKA